MASELLAKWLAHYDPIRRGWTLAGTANGICATNGYFFPMIRGGHFLRRSESGIPTAASVIVGAAGADDEEIRTFPWVTHAAGTAYTYRLTSVNGGGVENVTDAVIAETKFDDAGDWLGAWPNGPSDVRLVPLSAGRFALRWTYVPENEQVTPTSFQLYTLGVGGEIDYDAVAAQVCYRAGRLHYEYVTGSYAHGTRVGWAVRAYADGQGEEGNVVQVFGRARALAPPINPTVVVTFE